MRSVNQKKRLPLYFTLIVFFMSGCLSWEEGWKEAAKPSKKGDVKGRLEKADTQSKQADTKEKVLELTKTYESVLEIDPNNYEALSYLGSYYFLIGYGYAESKDEKEEYYLKAIKACERGMYTNADFRALVDKGESVWDASKVLSKKEMRALYFWYLSVGSLWTECLSGIGKLCNYYWTKRANKVLDEMMKIYPEWYGGSPYFSYAIYYTIVPGFLGGDMKKAEEYFDKAIKIGYNKVNFRTGRARYFHSKRGDKESFEKDLKWVIEQNPHNLLDPYPWAVFHQRDAKRLLENMKDYF